MTKLTNRLEEFESTESRLCPTIADTTIGDETVVGSNNGNVIVSIEGSYLPDTEIIIGDGENEMDYKILDSEIGKDSEVDSSNYNIRLSIKDSFISKSRIKVGRSFTLQNIPN